MLRRLPSAIAGLALAAALIIFGRYAWYQYQREEMKVTITRIRRLASILDAERTFVGSCEGAGRVIKVAPECTDAWGAQIHLRQSSSSPLEYVVWAQGATPETATFVYTASAGWTRLPHGAPP